MVPAAPVAPSTSGSSLAPPGSDRTVPLDAYPRHVRDRTVAFLGGRDDDLPIADLLAALPVPAEIDTHDDCASWHHTTPRPALVRTLLYNHAHGWQNDSRLHRALRHDPYLLGRFGFDTVPDQSTFWRVQHKQFSPELLATTEDAARELAAIAREHGYYFPGPSETPATETPERDGRLSGPGRTIRNAGEVTEQARRLAYPHLGLDRADNSTIPKAAFWDLQRYMGLQADCHANAGAREFALQSDHNVTPLGHNHREQLRSQPWWQYRQQLQDGIASIVAALKEVGQFQRPVTVAIDTTEGDVFLGDRDGRQHEIPGTKEQTDEYAYQWATIQIVDHYCPLVLDAIPNRKGESKDELVEELLSTAHQHVEIDLVVMDREFDSMAVKTVCEAHNVSSDASECYVVFETNHPNLDVDDDPETQRHAAARLMRRYRHRWEIENAYKRFRPFMAETTSKSFSLRYFYFAFAALVLYNLWKVVSLLVAERLEISTEEVKLPASTALALVGKATGTG